MTATTAREEYGTVLDALSHASVHRHFDAFLDIPWDDPEFAIVDDDERWILPDADELGGHPWYRALRRERQIEIGRYRLALICKVGLQFEQVLIAGMMNYLISARNGNPEFRYATHEVTEETHHTQMFQEFVNRVCPEVSGTPGWFRALAPVMAGVGKWLPAGFFVGILAGEEPIDHLQKAALRHGGLHPLITRVMQIHVAEEARHISFAHEYLRRHTPELGGGQRAIMTVGYPVVMRLLCDVIMVPSKQARRDMGIPDDVAREIWWDSPRGRAALQGLFSDARLLADDLGLRGPLGKLMWRLMKIDGRPSRYRSEPDRRPRTP